MPKKLTYNEVKMFAEENSECKLLSVKYTNNTTHMNFLCRCGNEFETNFAKFKDRSKRQCNACGREQRAKDYRFSFDYIKAFIEVESKSGCKLLSQKYINVTSNLKLICKCGKEFKATFTKFSSRNRRQCRSCGINIGASARTKTHEQFAEEVFKLVGDEYTVLGVYSSDSAKILMRHNACEYEYEATPSNILKDRRCPFCKSSKGEIKIAQWLKENNLNYKSEYSFSNLMSDFKNPLRFDFAVFDDCKNIKTLIEYDGGQHFHWVKGWQLERDFIKAQYHDELKNNYCKNHNIKLLRIPCTEFNNISMILENVLP